LEEENFSWESWDKHVIALKIHFVNWPAVMPACPGSSIFKYNNVKHKDWATLNNLTDGFLCVEPWSKGISIFLFDVDLLIE